jgi:hypothetical protein
MIDFHHALLASLLLSAIGLVACGTDSAATTQPQTTLPEPKTDTTAGRVLTITRVKTPWYGLRPLVVRGFTKSIPDYQQIKGLSRKMYILTQDGHFGGIYLWQSEADARRWFNEAWFARVQKTYGQPGTVAYYRIIKTTNFVENPDSRGNYRAVLSAAEPIPTLTEATPGLLRTIEVIDSAGKTGFVSLWQTEAQARAFFGDTPAMNTDFDVPVLLDNSH